MAGAFETRSCFSLSVTPIPAFDWGGDLVEPPVVFDTGPIFPIPPPFVVFDGCPCPTISTSVFPPGNTPSTSLSGFINPRGGDCCALDFQFNVFPPCVPDIVTSTSLGGVFKNRGGTYDMTAVGDGCTFNIIGIIDFPCPTLIGVTASNSQAWSNRQGSLIAGISDSSCAFNIDLSVLWPCPVQIPAPVVYNTNNWNDRSGSARLDISSGNCDWQFSLSLLWPCPAALKVGNILNSNNWGSRDGGLSVDAVKVDDCGWQLDFNVSWPCPAKVGLKTKQSWDFRRKSGHLSIVSRKSDSCSWDFDLSITWPCPADLRGNKNTNKYTNSKSGKAHIVVDKGNNCDFDLDLSVDWPCPGTFKWNVKNTYAIGYTPLSIGYPSSYAPGGWDRRAGGLAVWVEEWNNCEFNLQFDIFWPCPTAMRILAVNRYAYEPGTTIVTVDTEVTDPIDARHGLLGGLVVESSCEFNIDLQVIWPCPTKLVWVNTNNSWSYVPSVKSHVLSPVTVFPAPTPATGSLGFVRRSATYKQGQAGMWVEQSGCDFNLQFEIAWPCPPKLAMTVRNLQTWRFGTADQKWIQHDGVTYSDSVVSNSSTFIIIKTPEVKPRIGQLAGYIVEQNCEFALNFEIAWPCPTLFRTPAPVAKIGNRDASVLKLELSSASDCTFDLLFDLQFPCPVNIEAGSTSWISNWGQSGEVRITNGNPMGGCDIPLDVWMVTPCTKVELDLQVKTDLDPDKQPFWEKKDPTFKENCNFAQTMILHLPELGLVLANETQETCTPLVVSDLTWDPATKTLKIIKSHAVGYWG